MTATTNKTNGRDASGRFAPGNSFGRGRPRREVEQEYLQAFVDGCPPNELRAIVAMLTQKSIKGNLDAARLLLRHAMPAQQLRLELASQHAEYRVAGRSPAEGMAEMLERLQRKLQERREYEAELAAQGVQVSGPSRPE